MSTLTHLRFSLILLSSLILGGIVGYFFGPEVHYQKPFGDIFLNLIFTMIVPLIFFSVSSAMTRMNSLDKLGKLMFYMFAIFLLTSALAAIFMIGVVKIFPPAQNVFLTLTSIEKPAIILSDQLVNIFTVTDFSKLLSHQNILALIIFSIFVGLATLSAGEDGKIFQTFLQAGETVFMRVFSLIMYYAPIGFFAYFAVLVNDLGPKIIENYLHVTVIYYSAALIYFFIILSFYAFLAGKLTGIKLFWKNIFIPATTALATCSSAASIPANLQATKNMGVPAEIGETVIPLGTVIHKDGSVLGAVVKIAFLFGLFHLDFSGVSVLLIAIGVSILVGTVMGAIPSGGMLGELLILNVYGFPPSALMAIAVISMIIDPIATLLNVTSNSTSSMLITRLFKKGLS